MQVTYTIVTFGLLISFYELLSKFVKIRIVLFGRSQAVTAVIKHTIQINTNKNLYSAKFVDKT